MSLLSITSCLSSAINRILSTACPVWMVSGKNGGDKSCHFLRILPIRRVGSDQRSGLPCLFNLHGIDSKVIFPLQVEMFFSQIGFPARSPRGGAIIPLGIISGICRSRGGGRGNLHAVNPGSPGFRTLNRLLSSFYFLLMSYHQEGLLKPVLIFASLFFSLNPHCAKT